MPDIMGNGLNLATLPRMRLRKFAIVTIAVIHLGLFTNNTEAVPFDCTKILSAADSVQDFWIYDLPFSEAQSKSVSVARWVELLERTQINQVELLARKSYYASIHLGPAIRSGNRPQWVYPEQFEIIRAVTKAFLRLARTSLKSEGPFQLRDAEIRVERKGGPHYRATWHVDPWYLRVIVPLDGAGLYVWPRKAIQPQQIRRFQGLMFSGLDREKIIPGVRAPFHSSPVENLRTDQNPWELPLQYWWGTDYDVPEDRALLVIDIDIRGTYPTMRPTQSGIDLNEYK